MKAPLALIQLTYLDAAVAAVRSDALSEPILIGRDESAAWRPPEGDRTMGARAAVLRMKGGAPLLKAEPGAAFRVNGVEMREHVLRVGDRVSVGDCEISVAPVRERRYYAPCHRLEELGGDRKGTFVELKGENFTVGSAADAGLRRRDDTVSRLHATLTLRGEECWIRDAASRNGTRVNGQRLGGKDRLLRDGDVLSFGPFDYRFLDRAVSHVRTNLAKGVFAVLLTLLVAAGAWYAFYQRAPRVSDYLLAARQYALVERFDDAERMLHEARKAPGFDSVEAAWRTTREHVVAWRATYDAWADFKKNLADGRIQTACKQIGLLSLDRPSVWDWNSQTLEARLAEAREAAMLAQFAFDLWCARYDSDLSDESLCQLAAVRSRYGTDRPGFAEDERPWMKALKRDVVSRMKLFDENERRYVLLTNSLARLATGDPDFSAVTNDVDKTLHETTGRVRLFAHMLGDPLEKLMDDHQAILADARALSALDAAAYGGRPVVTTPDDCACSKSLGDCQLWCVEQRRKLDLASLELRALRRRLRALGADGTDAPSPLVALEDTNRVERAFRCELLKAPRPPRSDRTAPADDEYDRLFGYEYLYTYMMEGYYAFPKDVVMSDFLALAFKPEIQKLWEIYEEIERDLKVLEGKEFSSLMTGPLAELKARLAAWRERIRAVAKSFGGMADAAGAQDPRRAILARGAAIYLTPNAEVEQAVWDDFRKRANWYREHVYTRLYDLNPTDMKKSREAYDWIMSKGLPGSPPVKKAWNYRQ